VVVGLCAHGLAIVRNLARHEVSVLALDQNPDLPGCHTRLAVAERIADSNGEGLVDELIRVSTKRGLPPDTVLFLTNDRQVATIAGAWQRLEGRFRLSWAGAADAVSSQLEKSAHDARAAQTGCSYPTTRTISDARNAVTACLGLHLPLIAKPVRPLGSFKTRILERPDEILNLCSEHPSALPLLVQPFIPGDDEQIYFCALYLREGQVLARFDGHKLRSKPMGHTTVAEPTSESMAYEVAQRYFGGLRLSGPCSLEIKLDPAGQPWIIEPTVGRTDFWVDVCCESGVELPWVEYCDQIGLPSPPVPERTPAVWLNTERDPVAAIWLLRRMMLGRFPYRRLIFPYARLSDPVPFLVSLKQFVRMQIRRLLRRVARMIHDERAENTPRG